MNAEPIPETSEKIPFTTHSTFFLCIVMVVVFCFWASKSTLDIVSMTTGEVIPSTQVKTIQHLEGGIVREILVKEGRKVNKDQSLMILEPTVGEADVAELLVRLTSLQGDIAQLEALERGALQPVFTDSFIRNHPDLVRQAKRRFDTRLSRRDDDIKKQDQAVVQREQAVIQREQAVIQRKQEILEISARINGGLESLKIIQKRLKISEELLKDNLTNMFQHLDLQNENQKIKSSLDADRAGLAGAKAALQEAQASLREVRASLREAKAERNSLQSLFKDENQKALDEARLNFGELNQRIKKFEDSLMRTTVRSPIDGFIKTLHIGMGGVLRPGDPVADIVPADDRLIVEAQLPTQDIGHVAVGQPAVIKLASADAMRYGSLTGAVVHVSPDTLITPEGSPFYKVRIELDQSFFQRGKFRHELFPGMQVMTSIQTGDRTVMQYLLDPVMFRLGDAMQER